MVRDQSLAKEGYDVITFTLSGDWVFLEPVDNQQEITSSNDNWYFRLSFDPEDSLQISQDPYPWFTWCVTGNLLPQRVLATSLYWWVSKV